jgi:NAD(P)-dependent dehydrogenase (short-subunit alcohol dehydrogenase family)
VSLAGKSVIVTGAGSGIGACIAERAAEAGAHLTVTGRRAAPLRTLARRLGTPVHPVCADLGATDAGERIVMAAVDRFGRVDAVVNSAGLAGFAPFDASDPALFDGMLAVNVRGPAELVRCALPWLRAERGAVVNVTSATGATAAPGRSFYLASKAALNSLTRSLARELAPDVRVNAVLPGPMGVSRSGRVTGLDGVRHLRGGLGRPAPQDRSGAGDAVARLVCFLLDAEQSGWITGTLIPVDGGWSA